MAFHVGQKVVCVDASDFDLRFGESAPKEREVYTIRGFHEDGDAIWLTEIHNAPHVYDAFFLWRFRPVRTVSISIFTSMLTKPPAKTKRRERA